MTQENFTPEAQPTNEAAAQPTLPDFEGMAAHLIEVYAKLETAKATWGSLTVINGLATDYVHYGESYYTPTTDPKATSYLKS